MITSRKPINKQNKTDGHETKNRKNYHVFHFNSVFAGNLFWNQDFWLMVSQKSG
jgi:hypothetical protein